VHQLVIRNFDNSRMHGINVRKNSLLYLRSTEPFTHLIQSLPASSNPPQHQSPEMESYRFLYATNVSARLLSVQKKGSSPHGTPTGRQHPEQNHQQPTRHISLHSPLHLSGPTTTSIRNPSPNVLNGAIAHAKLTLTLILQQSPQRTSSPCFSLLCQSSFHRSYLPGEILTTIKWPLLRLGDLKSA